MLKCPSCGNTEEFAVAKGKKEFLVDGEENFKGLQDKADLDKGDECICPECQRWGTVKSFRTGEKK